MCLLMKLLERGRTVWPRADGGVVSPSRAQRSMLPEGIDWRQPVRTVRECCSAYAGQLRSGAMAWHRGAFGFQLNDRAHAIPVCAEHP
ncbi:MULTISPECIES: IS66 family insertion sequence element accessory protein TnpB [Burkholderia]|uniref:IS66 family insertion sequence element accessory protein TnpB n=1 Tax=Burkholderia TaxID=32008 RepID=UPI001ABA3AA9